MKKLLILAYDFPPYVSVGGMRPNAWFKYLKEFDIEPIVVTRQWGNDFGDERDYIAPSKLKDCVVENSPQGIIHRSAYRSNWSNRTYLKYGISKFKILRKGYSGILEFGQFFLPVGTKYELYREARKILKNQRVDAIIATGDPFVLFHYANKLSKEFSIPWIADYRDPWSHSKLNQRNFIQRGFNRYFEKKIVKNAQELITVSDFIAIKLKEYFPDKKINVILNGYDAAVIDPLVELPQESEKLTFALTGTIYNWHPWRLFLKVCSEFAAQGKELQINFYGVNNGSEIKLFLKELPISFQKMVTVYGKIPNQELMERIAKENVMLLFNYYFYMGTKIFDYAGIKRKMILCFENDSEANQLKKQFYTIEERPGVSNRLQADLIEETNAGIVIQDQNHLFQILDELYTEFQETGKIACNSKGVENYSRKIQVKKLAEIIHEI